MKSEYITKRYNNPAVDSLLKQIGDKCCTQQLKDKQNIKQQRKLSYSFSTSTTKVKQFENRPLFNNKTRQGSLLDHRQRQIPYIFIPKYKNHTFIMPDRIFEKGNAAKRFHIKMKDTSIHSFAEPEQQSQIKKILKKVEKEKTILSRQVQEYNRIIDIDDGRTKAKFNSEFLKTRKRFKYTDGETKLFSYCEPMMGPAEPQGFLARKISLAKTFDFSSSWRPKSRGNPIKSSMDFKTNFSQNNPHNSSVL